MSLPVSAAHEVAEYLGQLSRPIHPIPTGVRPHLQDLEGIQVVVFDVYGTLLCSGVGDISVDQATDREPALRAAMEAVGLKITTQDRLREKWIEEVQAHQYVRRKEGIAFPEVDICSVWKTFLDKMRASGCVQGSWNNSLLARVSIEYECRVNPAWPMPGFHRVLDTLKASHMRLGIISNAQFFTPILLEVLSKSSLENLGFERAGCVWSFEQFEAKPSVVLYERSASYWESRHGISPQDVLYVGNDILNDIFPAQKVGFKTALFAGDARSLRMRDGDARVERVKPDIVLTGLEQLLEILALSPHA